MKIHVNRKNLIPISEISNHFSKYFHKLKEQSDPIYIMKNNSIEAIMLDIEVYEDLLEIKENYEELRLID